MDLQFRHVMSANALSARGSLLTPPGSTSGIRSDPTIHRPATGLDLSIASPEMEKTQPIPTGKRRGGSRKACNECKQQKLRCDIVQTPAAVCSRCRRLGIECKVEPSFKRISKRRRNAEMEKEIADLRRRLASGEHARSGEARPSDELSQSSEDAFCGPGSATSNTGRPLSVPVEPQPSLTSPLTAIQGHGSILSQDGNPWRLEDVSLSRGRVSRLFEQYFRFYHPFLPLLDPQKGPEEYLNRSSLLAWTIVCVASRRAPSEPGLLISLSGPYNRLLWTTITAVPQDYHVVKALCLLCTWPLPTTSQRTDATFMLSGLMMQIAMQLGLHRPVQAEEFTTFRMEVKGEALKDRLQTWVVCNIVAQTVATGYGQPPSTIYDWALEPASLNDADYHPSDELRIRLRIEKFCDRVTRALYSSKPEAAEFLSSEKLLIVQLLESELKEMEVEFCNGISHVNMIHLRAAELHLRYFVFLGASARSEDVTKLFIATTSFLGRVLDLETSPGELLGHATNYILQMIVSAAFALMKMLKSSFNRHIDFEHGKLLFNGAISAIRRVSVMDHDRPVRLADILAQMWNANGSEVDSGEDALHLKVRCRMSMSHVYDTVWHWRQRFRPMRNTDDVQSVAANQNMVNTAGSVGQQPDSNTLNDPTLVFPAQFQQGFMGEAGFSEVFDSLNWVFDGIPDSLVAPPVI